LIAISTLSATALAQTGGAVVGKGPGVAGAAQTVKVTAKITKINAKTHEVTVKGPEGREVTLQLSPEVKNFKHMKVGDTVTAEYVEALTLELKKGGKAVVGRTEQAGAATAKPGEKPAALAGRQLTIVADVTAVDPATQTVTLKGPKRTVDVKVADPEQFKLIQVGDQVEAKYTEALAIAVETTPAKK
jgi:ABC-type transport system substrate-binding protein